MVSENHDRVSCGWYSVIESSTQSGPSLMTREELTQGMLSVVAKYERRFGIRFSRFVLMTRAVLRCYAVVQRPERAAQITIGAGPSVGEHIERIMLIANRITITREEREVYRESLEQIYRALPTHTITDALVIAPQREGAILARRLGWLANRHLCPNLKRMPFDGGLLMGCDSELEGAERQTVHLVDGALATGATAITVLAICRPLTATVFCAHATVEGLTALVRFAAEIGTELSCVVGEVSGVLNDRFYAVMPEAPDQVRVGDLGDMIAPLEADLGSREE